MTISKAAKATIDKAVQSDDLQSALIVGIDGKGKLSFYCDDADKERMVALLERAKIKLINTMG